MSAHDPASRPSRRPGRLGAGALAALALVLILFAMMKMLDPIASQMLYPVPPVPVPSPPPEPLREADLRLSGGERISAWASPAPVGEARPCLLFFHGNGENLATMAMAGLYRDLEALGVSFLAVDYPGYGRSDGRPSEASLLAAAEAGLTEVEKRFPEAPKIVLGWSLGAAVAARLAARHPERVDGLLLLSPWDSLRELAGVHFPGWMVKLALRDAYDSEAAVRGLEMPALLIHGRDDRIIPIVHGRRLAAAFPSPPRFVEVPDTGHNDLLSRPVVWREMAAFLARFEG